MAAAAEGLIKRISLQLALKLKEVVLRRRSGRWLAQNDLSKAAVHSSG
jgi:hypothetical protein